MQLGDGFVEPAQFVEQRDQGITLREHLIAWQMRQIFVDVRDHGFQAR